MTSWIKPERWQDIPGYEGRYQASTYGRIRSLDLKVGGVNPYTKKEFIRTVPGRILRPGKQPDGRLSVILGKGTSGKLVHRLVMLTFKGEPPPGQEVLHNDGDPTNNHLDNLRYGTRTENILDVYALGRPWRKLTTEQVREIRKRLKTGERLKDIAKDYDVQIACISAIKNRRTYWWLKD